MLDLNMLDVLGQDLRAMTSAGEAVVRNKEYIFSHYKFIAFALAALQHVASQNQLPKLNADTKKTIADILDLGILINDHFDVGILDTKKYKRLRKEVNRHQQEENFLRYFTCIRNLERNRPKPGNLDACIAYREKVNLISISLSCAVAFSIPVNDLISYENKNGSDPALNMDSPHWFQSLFNIIMSGQVTDDLIGWQADSFSNRPSFYTGLIGNKGEKPTAETISILTRLHNQYLEKAKDLDPTTSLPFRFFLKFGHDIYTKTYLFLLKNKQEKLLLLFGSHRDKKEFFAANQSN